VETPHVGDIGTVIYLPTFAGEDPLGETLETFTTRIVRLQRPGNQPLIEITEVTLEVDPADAVKKLKLVTGTETGTALTGTGDFALTAADVGQWLAEIQLGHATGQWTMDAFPVFTLLPNLP
jgi:hypothetical protein